MQKWRGFTLIESVVAMVMMAIAMVTLTSFLVPQLASSADPHYQSRSAALAQSVMTNILSRKFDQNTQGLGNEIRCSSVDPAALPCTTNWDDSEAVKDLNDIDDYEGCWVPNGTASCRDLYDLISNEKESGYHNFRLDIKVSYAPDSSSRRMKRIDLTVTAGKQTPIEYVAYRGNY
ncbi:MSHA biogenesis protein MshD [Vibrio panuliri]|uniref:MSHA biogenesis protein MshD n=1 Tax=Vibrio panuliri TaxID=1381081 RepID=A0A1Q9HC59_9VIBR|nr:type II secretion system protein [Vibrio panuliri]OLQ86967.1 MSHA biogenesis protein MshD [Vibrio panuliri]